MDAPGEGAAGYKSDHCRDEWVKLGHDTGGSQGRRQGLHNDGDDIECVVDEGNFVAKPLEERCAAKNHECGELSKPSIVISELKEIGITQEAKRQ